MPAASSDSFLPDCRHDGEHLQCADQAVTGCGLIQYQHVTGRLAADIAACLTQFFQHIAVADFGAA